MKRTSNCEVIFNASGPGWEVNFYINDNLKGWYNVCWTFQDVVMGCKIAEYQPASCPGINCKDCWAYGATLNDTREHFATEKRINFIAPEGSYVDMAELHKPSNKCYPTFPCAECGNRHGYEEGNCPIANVVDEDVWTVMVTWKDRHGCDMRRISRDNDMAIAIAKAIQPKTLHCMALPDIEEGLDSLEHYCSTLQYGRSYIF